MLINLLSLRKGFCSRSEILFKCQIIKTRGLRVFIFYFFKVYSKHLSKVARAGRLIVIYTVERALGSGML